jgi:sugar (pentulose or hexulose) kinase
MDKKEMFHKLISNVKRSDTACDDIFSCNYHSGETITNFLEGRPLLVYHTNSGLNLSSLFRSFIYSAFATLRIGYEILMKEKIKSVSIVGHGGMFQDDKVAQTILAASLDTPITVMQNASQGGPYGIALLAKYLFHNKYSLSQFLDKVVFANQKGITIRASKSHVRDYDRYIEMYRKCLKIERTAIDVCPSSKK